MKEFSEDYEDIQSVSVFSPFHLKIVYEPQPVHRFEGSSKEHVAFLSPHKYVGLRGSFLGAHSCSTYFVLMFASKHKYIELENMFKELDQRLFGLQMLNRHTVPDLPASLDTFIIWDIRAQEHDINSIVKSMLWKVICGVFEVHDG